MMYPTILTIVLITNSCILLVFLYIIIYNMFIKNKKQQVLKVSKENENELSIVAMSPIEIKSELEAELNRCIENEDYERASQIRDIIKTIRK